MKRKYFKSVLLVPIVMMTASLPLFAHDGEDHSGSSAHVEVKNNVSVNSNSTTTSQTKTNVRIETNGQVQEYSSENGEDVHMESQDGSVRVNINNNGTSAGDSPREEGSESRVSVTPGTEDKTSKSDDEKEETKKQSMDKEVKMQTTVREDDQNIFVEVLLFVPKKIWGFFSDLF